LEVEFNVKMHLCNRLTRRLLQKVRSKRRPPGFTVIELMIVMAIIAILVGMAAINYQKTLIKSKEAVLNRPQNHARRHRQFHAG